MRWVKTPRLFVFILLIQVSNAILVNQTIDDGLGDSQTGFKVQYLPLADDLEPVWNSQDTCGGCAANPDPKNAYNNTWSSATCLDDENVAATFTFHGTAIYIYFIIASYPYNGAIMTANCNFWLDGQLVKNYRTPPEVFLQNVLQYNQLVYANTSLSNMPHTIAMEAKSESFMIFDYAQYTIDVPTSPSAPGTASTSGASGTTTPLAVHKGVIAGGTIAGVAGVGLIALIIILYRRRAVSGDTLEFTVPRLHTQRGHVSPFMLANEPATISIPRSKTRSGYTRPFMPGEAGSGARVSDYPRVKAILHNQGGSSTQTFISRLVSAKTSVGGGRWRAWEFNRRGRADLPWRFTAAVQPTPVLIGSSSSNIFE